MILQRVIESDSSEWVKGVTRERVRLANDQQVKDRSLILLRQYCCETGTWRLTSNICVIVDHPRSFLKALSILFRVGFPHKNTERPASQSCSLPSPQHSVEYGWFHRAQIERCSDSIGLSHNLRLLLVYYYGEISSISEIGLSISPY